nr:hypothetical protein GCM10020063_090770 [Dactylosporangium thailandense]
MPGSAVTCVLYAPERGCTVAKAFRFPGTGGGVVNDGGEAEAREADALACAPLGADADAPGGFCSEVHPPSITQAATPPVTMNASLDVNYIPLI